ncbi:MAG TPA: RNA polymerase sigma factor [Solirubrobacteraceae bacterium]
MEGYTLRQQQPRALLRGGSPLLRLASDERLITLTRCGQQSAFETLVSRYQQRLLAFCRHMLRSREDAEDVLQEVFAAAFNAIMADSREINVRPWLYRIARNRSLNHLRRTTAIGVDSMDTHFSDAGQSTSEKVHRREEFRLLVDDIGHLPESQRSALVLREMDALSYEQIAEAMDTTVSSVKSLLVRARIGLAEAAEARKLSCEEVRFELGESAEGLRKLSPPVRRHIKGCTRCRTFRTQLRSNNRALAAIMPLGPLLLFKKALIFKLGLAKLWAGGASGGAATAGGAGAGGGAAAAGTAVAVSGGSVGGFTAGAVAAKVALVVVTAAAVGVGSQKILDPHHVAAPPAHATQALSAVAPTAAAVALPLRQRQPALMTGTSSAGRRLRLLAPAHVPSLPAPYLRGPATVGSAVTDTPALAQTPASPPVVTSAPPSTTPTATPTPTTQEISTTTAFSPTPSGGGAVGGGVTGTSGTTTTTIIGATGSTTGETISTTTSLIGSTGTTSATGATATTGGATGATGSLTDAGDEADSAPSTGSTGS